MKKFKVFSIVFVLSLAFLFFLSITPFFYVKSVNINEINQRNHNFDMEIFDISLPYFYLDTDSIEKQALNSGLIKSISIDKNNFLELNIEITWKKAFITIESADKYVYIDEKGYVLYIENKSDELYCIEGLAVKSASVGHIIKTSDNQVLESSVNLLLLLDANPSIFQNAEKIRNVKIIKNEIIQIIGEKLWINYGNGENIEEKFKSAVLIYQDLVSKNVNTGIINVSRKDHNVYEPW